jgi:iron-sulfur cluster repair protein YtfE (RIC family)
MATFRSGATAEYELAEHNFAEHEHEDLEPGIARIHALARVLGSNPPPDWSVGVLRVIDWVETVLQPHAAWEDEWLYPEIARRAGSPWATRLMTFEHQQVLVVARRLQADHALLPSTPTREAMVDLSGALFALEALLRAHIEREERFLLPLIAAEPDTAAAERAPA